MCVHPHHGCLPLLHPPPPTATTPGVYVKPGRDRELLAAMLRKEGYAPVWLESQLLDLYYNGFCNRWGGLGGGGGGCVWGGGSSCKGFCSMCVWGGGRGEQLQRLLQQMRVCVGGGGGLDGWLRIANRGGGT
jgi:hypothetical protein